MPTRGPDSAKDYEDCLDQLREIVIKYQDNHTLILCGDLNGHPTKNVTGHDRLLASFCRDLRMELPHSYYQGDSYVHKGGMGSSKIDHILVSSEHLNAITEVKLLDLEVTNTSDHHPIAAEVSSYLVDQKQSHTKKQKPPIRYKIQWDKLDKRAYLHAVKEKVNLIQLNSMVDTFNVDRVFAQITNIITTAAENSAPLKKITTGKKAVRPWSPEISRLVKQNKEIYWKLKNTSNQQEIEKLHATNYKLKKTIRSEQRKLAADRREHEQKEIMSASEDDNQLFYKLIKKQRSTPRGSTELMIDDNLITDNEDLLNAWADHFERLATPTDDPNFDFDFKSITENSFDIIREFTSLNTHSKTNPVSTEEVMCAMRKLNTKKASDMDGISAEHIIYADEALAPILATLFTQMRRLSYIPPQLKKGYIIPLPKKGKNSLLQDNYRGITITSTFSKLHENIEAPRLRELFQDEQSSMQRGFSNGSSSTNAALIVSELMNEARDSKKELFIASLDARKAFDVVYQKSLFVKLFDIGVEPDLWRIMLNWYDGASSQVRWNNQYSREFELLQGLRQGGCTSTDMYKIFINPLLRKFGKL